MCTALGVEKTLHSRQRHGGKTPIQQGAMSNNRQNKSRKHRLKIDATPTYAPR